jgi:GTPase SAR1 family protein
MTGRLVCPYCYESFRPWEMQFRCTGRTSRAGKACPRKADQVLQERTGRRDALPPVFSANGFRRRAVCPTCGDQTGYRVCPVCHSELPLDFARVASRMIAMIGARNSGKTVFMTVLIHELTHRVGARFGASVVGSDDHTRSRFSTAYEKVLYEAGALVPVTASAGQREAGKVQPLVFRLATDRKGLLGRSGTTRTVLSFFDTAGEDLASQRGVEMHARYLSSADGIVLVLDPLQMPGARRLAAQGVRLPDALSASDTPLNVLGRVTDLLRHDQRRRSSARMAKPIAVTFSKLDALWHRFDPASPLRRQAEERPHFDEADSLSVHEEVRALLKDWEGDQVDGLLRHNYARYRYFGFSALGETPTPDNRVSPRGIRPYRVQDPFLWLLAEFGTIPKEG